LINISNIPKGPLLNSVTKTHFCKKRVKLGSHLSNEYLSPIVLITTITNMLFKRNDYVFIQDFAPVVNKAKTTQKWFEKGVPNFK